MSDDQDYSKLSNEEIRQLFSTIRPQCDWDKFFAKLFLEKNMYNIIDELRECQNFIAHCKPFPAEQYIDSRELLKKAIKPIDRALINITPKCDELMDGITEDNNRYGCISMTGQIVKEKSFYNSADLEEVVRSVAETIVASSAYSAIDTDISEPLRYITPKHLGKQSNMSILIITEKVLKNSSVKIKYIFTLKKSSISNDMLDF